MISTGQKQSYRVLMSRKRHPNFIIPVVLIMVLELYCLTANATNSFQGTWTNDNGRVNIASCKEKKCKVEINTANGAHTCDINEELTVLSNRTAVFQLKDLNVDSDDKKRLLPINLSLSKQVITVSIPQGSKDAARGYCGARGFFEGEYTNSNIPRVYKTSFNCDNAKTKIEVAICQSPELAHADKVLSTLYNQLIAKRLNHIFKQQKEWLQDRNTCSVSSDLKRCLSNKYRDRILVLQQDLVSGITSSQSSKTNNNIPYNFDYLLFQSKHSDQNPYEIYAAPPLQNYLNVSLPKNTVEKILPAVFYEIKPEYFDDSLIMITGGAPGLYTICEGALVLTKDHQTWLAYIDIDKEHETQLIVLCPRSVNCDAQPEPLKKWVNRLLPKMNNRKIIYMQMLPDTV